MDIVARTWWNRENRPYDLAELRLDALVHLVGLVIAITMGSLLLYAAAGPSPRFGPLQVGLYVGSLIAVLSISLVFNQLPSTRLKMHFARLDQASIFLFMAGSYTPFLALLSGTALGSSMMFAVWGTAVTGIALKLFAPHRFGRVAIFLYLAIGWSGLVVFHDLARHVPDTALLLLVGGGVAYSVGIIFHLWEGLRFQNALWHLAVVTGASLHLWAVTETMGAT